VTWWVWVVAGLAIGAVELLAPGYIFVGFGIGALAVGGLVWAGAVGPSVPVQLALFAVLSVLAWLGMRRVLGVRQGQVKRIDRDIND
jgi:membrane protein implicated in regulation of membrane protease activity